MFTACTDYSDNPVKPVGIAIDEANFPDARFRQYLLYYYDFAPDGILTNEEIESTTELFVYQDDIESLKGIEYFTALVRLYCADRHYILITISLPRSICRRTHGWKTCGAVATS